MRRLLRLTALASLWLVPFAASLGRLLAAEAPAPAAEAAAPTDAEKTAELIKQLDSPEPARRSQAAEALGAAKATAAVPALLRLLDDPDEDAQWKATCALAAIGKPCVPPLLEALMHEKERVRWKAETALKMIAAEAVPDLTAALQDKRARIRQSAAFLLGEIKDARSLDALAAALGDKDEDTRWKAATSLTKFGAQATDATVKTLAAGSIEARRCAAWVFQQTRDPAAVPPLAKSLKDADEQVRWKAAIALQNIGRPAAEPLLGLLRAGGTDDEKSIAAWILEGIKDIAVQTALRDLKAAQAQAAPGAPQTPAIHEKPRPSVLPKSIVLAVTSDPARATVFVDDKYAGVTPVTLDRLSPGHHFIKLTKRDHLPWTKLIELLYPQEKLHAKLTPKPKGSLLVTSDPAEADVYLDGQYEGKTPLEKKDLDANPYSVRVEKEQFLPWETDIVVPAGQQAKAHGVLQSKVEAWYLDRLKQNPNDVSCHTELGHYYLVRGQLEPCVKAIARAVEVTANGADTSGYASRLVQEIAKMWGESFKFGGGLAVADVRKALHGALHDLSKRNPAQAGLKSFLEQLRQSLNADFTKPPA